MYLSPYRSLSVIFSSLLSYFPSLFSNLSIPQPSPPPPFLLGQLVDQFQAATDELDIWCLRITESMIDGKPTALIPTVKGAGRRMLFLPGTQGGWKRDGLPTWHPRGLGKGTSFCTGALWCPQSRQRVCLSFQPLGFQGRMAISLSLMFFDVRGGRGG